MTSLQNAQDRLLRTVIARTQQVSSRDNRDRGDVPGWVLITLMTAGLVTALWKFAQPALTSLFDNAISSVNGK
ncbi:hypothetical protein G9U51_11750 [Calidifontibacter sp. DB0510]|uniref:Uncharacterized protein n=1 Tax=Metallococcus carri TaxID=1656884 RepID=A0A967B1T8_9MICO|nr:hypothetical protein [Metallococcus carri]NHN56452.1 hypothetical protein [Metallococcus carri]NOP36076.1 hypothetical protein [Calidifontibacter sp. DB2511S]